MSICTRITTNYHLIIFQFIPYKSVLLSEIGFLPFKYIFCFQTTKNKYVGLTHEQHSIKPYQGRTFMEVP